MIYAGVTKDDPRVKAAYEWIQKHYTLDENPGMGGNGLYYYYHTFAKALDCDRRRDDRRWQRQVARLASRHWRRSSSNRRTPTAAGSTKPRVGSKVIRIS